MFGAQFKILDNGSNINYSPHTALVREDGKQPRVIRHDGLAFVPDPRVYGKSRPAALKDFVAYKHLPRAKPRVLAKSPKLDRVKQTTKQGEQNRTKSQVSPKKPPPKNLEQILSQSKNRRALGHDGLFKRVLNKTRANTANQDTAVIPKPTGKQNPINKLKKSRPKNADLEFECDTSNSLSDTDLTRKTPSPKKPAPKKLDTKKTPEDFDQQCRRSMRNRTSALAGKLGNAIPISTIEAQDRDIRNVVCQVEVIPTPSNTNSAQNQIAVTPHQSQQEVISLSSSIECVEIQLESDTPENIRARSAQREDVHLSTTEKGKSESKLQTSSHQRAISTRYVLDRPPQANTPDATFIKNFDSAMKLSKDISPIRNSMTFRSEKEDTSTNSDNKTLPTPNTPSQETKSAGDKAIKKK